MLLNFLPEISWLRNLPVISLFPGIVDAQNRSTNMLECKKLISDTQWLSRVLANVDCSDLARKTNFLSSIRHPSQWCLRMRPDELWWQSFPYNQSNSSCFWWATHQNKHMQNISSQVWKFALSFDWTKAEHPLFESKRPLINVTVVSLDRTSTHLADSKSHKSSTIYTRLYQLSRCLIFHRLLNLNHFLANSKRVN